MVEKDANFFLLSGVAGAFAANLTHVVLVPADVIKTRIQLNKELYPNASVAFKKITSQEGYKALSLGLGPTAMGYAVQGFLKYGLYEYFKDRFSKALGPELSEQYSTQVYLAAGTTAETFADLALCPFEAARIKSVSDPKYGLPTTSSSNTSRPNTFQILNQLRQQHGIARGWYQALFPLVAKQVPYTAVKFAVFEYTEFTLYESLPFSREAASRPVQLGVTFAAGVVGGLASAIASHPADSLLTRMNKSASASAKNGLFGTLAEMGWKGVWAGLLPRMAMVGTMAACQLLAYDAAKLALGLPTSQGVKKHSHKKGEEEKGKH